MRATEVEPGFLQAYRLFVATRIVFWVVIGPILIVLQAARESTQLPESFPDMTLIERLTLPNLLPMLAVELVLLALLTLPQVPKRLGRRFVPITLLIGLAPLLVGYYWWPSDNPLQTPFIIFFFVMLVLIAWQYPFRYVVAYVVGLSLYQAWTSSPSGGLPFGSDASWFILQAAMMLLVGYMVVQQTSIQRDQRAALAQAYQQQAAAHEKLQRYAATLEDLTISRERNRMARELHDTLAHSLSALTVQLEAVRSLWALNPDSARRMLDQADQTARNGLTEARRALQDLRATPLRDMGLVLALRDLAERAADRSGTELELQLPSGIAGSLPLSVEQGVYRIAQEALENIVRHAEARTLSVRLAQAPAGLELCIRDDGRGIAPELSQRSVNQTQSGMGLRGMQERANLIGGRLEIDSQPQTGTEVRLVVPGQGLVPGQTSKEGEYGTSPDL
jgi:signal transduction histidine kinase